MENRINVAQTTALSGAIGAGVGAIGTIARQKHILNNADAFITRAEGEVARAKMFNNPFHRGTQAAADLANAKLDEALEAFKKFATGGKLDFKAIAKKAGAVGAACAVIGGIVALAYNSGKKELRDNSKIVAEEFKNAKVGENE